jgi:hypothetical protein
MKRIFSASLAFTMACFLFISCQKSSVEPVKKTNIFSSAENRVAIAKALKTYFEEKNITSRTSNGAQFIVPFFTTEGIGIGNFDFVNFKLELANFSAELSGSDFYRENPDGTISVHVNSNNALAEYFADLFDPAALYLYGNRGHFDVNYTGEVVELFPGFSFIDTQNSGRAYSFHGNGNVAAEGVAPWKKLSAKMIITPSGQSQVDFTLK